VYNKEVKKTLWLAGLIVIVSIIYATVYLVAQQSLRMSANDPQIQMAEDAAAGAPTSTANLATTPKVDVAASLAPFLMVYDQNHQLVAGDVVLDGHSPVLPPGVLYDTTTGHENRLTWQPRGGVRIAAVVVKYNGGYVLAGRNLREIEQRETNALEQVILGWLLTVGFILAWAWLVPVKAKRG